VPFIPYGSKAPTHLGRLLIVDTATESGKTLRKAMRKYEAAAPLSLAVYDENDPTVGRVAFWYEATKPQRYKHERRV
jgi:peptidyl-tRNA hydrolase